MAKKLLIDFFGIIKPTLTEDTHGQMVARGEFGFADMPTENKRIYPRAIWEREIRKIQQAIEEGKVLGELDHPSDGKTSLKRVSHVMRGLNIADDGKITGEAVVCENEHGKQLKSILAAGGSVGVSSRGMGSTSVNEDGYEVVQEDYSYMTHDFVADPAVKTSYPKFSSEAKDATQPIVTEVKSDKETVMETKKVEEKKEEVKPVAESKAVDTKPAETKPVEAAAPAVPVTLSEDQVKEKLDAQKKELQEAFSKELETKLAEAKKASDSDPKMVAGKLVLEDVAKILRPVLLPEDVQLIVIEKDKEISSLKTMIESKAKEIVLIEEKCKKSLTVAKDLGMLLHFEKELGEDVNRESVRALVGDPKKFLTHTELTEAVKGAKAAISKLVSEKDVSSQKEKQLREEFEKQISDLKAENLKVKESLNEAATLAKTFGLKAYVMEKVKNNPNSARIIRLCESVKTKDEADAVIEKYSVNVDKPNRDFTEVRNRFAKPENSTLVEDHVRETGVNKPTPKSVVTEGIDAEMTDLFAGASLDLVKDLGGLQ